MLSCLNFYLIFLICGQLNLQRQMQLLLGEENATSHLKLLAGGQTFRLAGGRHAVWLLAEDRWDEPRATGVCSSDVQFGPCARVLCRSILNSLWSPSNTGSSNFISWAPGPLLCLAFIQAELQEERSFASSCGQVCTPTLCGCVLEMVFSTSLALINCF